MSAEGVFAPAGQCTLALLDRVRAASRVTFWRRLLIWTAVVAVVSAGVRLLVPDEPIARTGWMVNLSFTVSGCAGLLACVYCFARFVLCLEVRYLLTSAAFSALATGAVLQLLADMRSPAASNHGWITTASWLAAAVLFAGAAYSSTVWTRSTRWEGIQQIALGLITIGSFGVAGSPYALDPQILATLSASVEYSLVGYLAESIAGACALLLVVLAVLGYHHRLRCDGERVAGLICCFLVPCAFGLLFRAACAERFGPWGTSGDLILGASWLVLVMGVAVENAFSHKESQDRLRELEGLHEISWSLVGAGSLRELLDLFVRTLVEKTGAKIAAVYLADGSREKLELSAASGADSVAQAVGAGYPLSSESRFPGFHSGHTARAFNTREMQIASDVFVDVEFVPWRVIAVDDGCAASLPLMDQDRAIGVLNVYFSQRESLSAQRLKMLHTIAAAATPAIQHARAREQLDYVLDFAA